MRKLLPLWIIILIIWLIGGCFVCKNYFCGVGGGAAAVAAIADEDVVKKAPIAAATGWLVNDNKNFRTNSPEHFSYKKNNAAYLPMTTGVETNVERTATYLKNNENRVLDITGYYTSDEKNNSIFNNLGMARADKVKNLLLGAGVGAAQINTFGKILPDKKWLSNDTFNKGIDFTFSERSKEDKRIPLIKDRLLGKPVTLYFQTNSDNINLSTAQRTDFTDLIYYLDRVPNAKLEIGGHTDNVGQINSNVALSKKRAEFAANYINSRGGISKNKMAIQGFGPNKPVANNSTAEGRQKNRRVEVTLK